jgi:hypothetical protein
MPNMAQLRYFCQICIKLLFDPSGLICVNKAMAILKKISIKTSKDDSRMLCSYIVYKHNLTLFIEQKKWSKERGKKKKLHIYTIRENSIYQQVQISYKKTNSFICKTREPKYNLICRILGD